MCLHRTLRPGKSGRIKNCGRGRTDFALQKDLRQARGPLPAAAPAISCAAAASTRLLPPALCEDGPAARRGQRTSVLLAPVFRASVLLAPLFRSLSGVRPRSNDSSVRHRLSRVCGRLGACPVTTISVVAGFEVAVHPCAAGRRAKGSGRSVKGSGRPNTTGRIQARFSAISVSLRRYLLKVDFCVVRAKCHIIPPLCHTPPRGHAHKP
mmetsp:Transcript_33233/g.82758  ORF Transcript_33233/g.82758 Transcript_33233/m.82758 type:complete len:209 (-) Transcript_33233:568-1194(-)